MTKEIMSRAGCTKAHHIGIHPDDKSKRALLEITRRPFFRDGKTKDVVHIKILKSGTQKECEKYLENM